MYGLTVITAPTSDPLTVAEAKQHLQMSPSYTGEDSYLSALIAAATNYIETRCNIAVMSQTLELAFDNWPCYKTGIRLPKPPLVSVTSVKYLDPSNVQQTWSSSRYVVSVDRRPGTIRPGYGYIWPIIRPEPDAVRVRYVAGYSSADAVPAGIKHAIRLLIGNAYQQRTSEVTGATTASVAHALDSLLLQYDAGDEFVGYGGESD